MSLLSGSLRCRERVDARTRPAIWIIGRAMHAARSPSAAGLRRVERQLLGPGVAVGPECSPQRADIADLAARMRYIIATKDAPSAIVSIPA